MAYVEVTVAVLIVSMSVPSQVVAALYLDLDRGAFGAWVALNVAVSVLGLRLALWTFDRSSPRSACGCEGHRPTLGGCATRR